MSKHQFLAVQSQLESDVRLQKNLAATAKKFQSELAKLKNEGKKLKDSGSGDKPNSEYEMLLNEKDALIAEYLSGLYSKHSHQYVNGNFMSYLITVKISLLFNVKKLIEKTKKNLHEYHVRSVSMK